MWDVVQGRRLGCQYRMPANRLGRRQSGCVARPGGAFTFPIDQHEHEALGSCFPRVPDRMRLHPFWLLVLFQGKMRVTQDSISMLIYEDSEDDPDEASILHIPIDQVRGLIQASA